MMTLTNLYTHTHRIAYTAPDFSQRTVTIDLTAPGVSYASGPVIGTMSYDGTFADARPIAADATSTAPQGRLSVVDGGAS